MEMTRDFVKELDAAHILGVESCNGVITNALLDGVLRATKKLKSEIDFNAIADEIKRTTV